MTSPEEPEKGPKTAGRPYTELEFRIRWGKPVTDYRDKFPIYHSNYGRVWHIRCHYCHLVDPELGPDNSHHSMAKMDTGKFRCIRCGTSGTFDYLFKSYVPSPRKGKGIAPTETNNVRRGNKDRLGRTIQLLGLPRTHIVWRYLFDEGFTENQILFLADQYGILYCEDGFQIGPNEFNVTTHRLVFLFKKNGRVEGWQARWLPYNYEKRKEQNELAKSLKISKYLISPGFQKLQMPYNMDVAWENNTIVAVEGVKKVWKTGAFSIGTLGMQMLLPKNPLENPDLYQYWHVKALKDKKRLVILFDRSGMKSAVALSAWYMKYGGEARVVVLPEGEPDDLDDYTTKRIQTLIREQIPADWLPEALKNT